MAAHGFTERELDVVAGYILMIGAGLAVCLIVAGTVLMLIQAGGAPLPPLTAELPSVVWADALRLHARGLLNLGVLVLMATPVLRVVCAVVGFSLLRFWRFALVSLVVPAMLAAGALTAIRGM